MVFVNPKNANIMIFFLQNLYFCSFALHLVAFLAFFNSIFSQLSSSRTKKESLSVGKAFFVLIQKKVRSFFRSLPRTYECARRSPKDR